MLCDNRVQLPWLRNLKVLVQQVAIFTSLSLLSWNFLMLPCEQMLIRRLKYEIMFPNSFHYFATLRNVYIRFHWEISCTKSSSLFSYAIAEKRFSRLLSLFVCSHSFRMFRLPATVTFMISQRFFPHCLFQDNWIDSSGEQHPVLDCSRFLWNTVTVFLSWVLQNIPPQNVNNRSVLQESIHKATANYTKWMVTFLNSFRNTFSKQQRIFSSNLHFWKIWNA